MLSAITTLFSLQWRQQKPREYPLPPHITRKFVSTSGGDLELIVCEPKITPTSKTATPLIFFHGGYGHCAVWLDWMNELYEKGYSAPMYAHSLRNHGASYSLPYWNMVMGVSMSDLADDAVALVNAANEDAQSRGYRTQAAFVGHSSGGGLSQYLLANDLAQASALCVVGGIPHYGSYDVYYNWWKHDKWFPLRSMFHLQHPTSPLSTPYLVHRAFFGHDFPISRVSDFMQWMPAYESMGWASGMLGSFSKWWSGKNEWLDIDTIVKNLDTRKAGTDRVCNLVGREDMMFWRGVWQRQSADYKKALTEAGFKSDSDMSRAIVDEKVDGVSVERLLGVRTIIVEGQGHHVQNDLKYKEAAEAFMRWAEQLS